MLFVPLAMGVPGLDPKPKAMILVGLATLYLAWGGTYLAVHVALESFPPLFLMAVRCVLAGVVLFGSAVARGSRWPTWREWRGTAVLGILFFVSCHGVLAVAQQNVPSGLAALLLATIPLWVPLVTAMGPAGELPTARTASGVGIGFLGVAFLIAGTRGILWSGADVFSVVLLLIAALSWAIGTVVSRALAPPASPVKAAGMELLVGGGILLAASAAAGELSQLSASGILARSIAALVYLIILGSVVGFSVYNWLLGVTTPNRIATYAYVNPVVAVLLGAVFLGEPLTANTIVAATIILGSIAVTVLDNDREAGRPETCRSRRGASQLRG